MIDGVLQFSLLCNGLCDVYMIDLVMIECIEIVEGFNVLQGFGVVGGIINIIIWCVLDKDGIIQCVVLDVSVLMCGVDGFGYGGLYVLGVWQGVFDVVVGVFVCECGMYFDVYGWLIGVDGIQGDLMDLFSYDLFVKFGYDFVGEWWLQFMVNCFQLQGYGDYIVVFGDMVVGLFIILICQLQFGDVLCNCVFISSLDYCDLYLVGGELCVQLYYQVNCELFGGGIFGIFQDLVYGDIIFDQLQNVLFKCGVWLFWLCSGLFDEYFNLLVGVDGYCDIIYQELVQIGCNWVLDSIYIGWVLFLQVEFWVLFLLLLNGGLCQEYGWLDVLIFCILVFYKGVIVQGGFICFSKMLLNFGVVWYFNDWLNLFVSYVEGYILLDVGCVLCVINVLGQNVVDFFDFKLVVLDNWEVGVEYVDGGFIVWFSYYIFIFWLGLVLVFDVVNQVYNVVCQCIEISGWEVCVGWKLFVGMQLMMSYVINYGCFDCNGDGCVDFDLDGVNIVLNCFNLSWIQ